MASTRQGLVVRSSLVRMQLDWAPVPYTLHSRSHDHTVRSTPLHDRRSLTSTQPLTQNENSIAPYRPAALSGVGLRGHRTIENEQ